MADTVETRLRINPSILLLIEMDRKIKKLRNWREKARSAIGVSLCILTVPLAIMTCVVFFVLLPFDGHQHYVRDSFALFDAMFALLAFITALTLFAALTWLVVEQ